MALSKVTKAFLAVTLKYRNPNVDLDWAWKIILDVPWVRERVPYPLLDSELLSYDALVIREAREWAEKHHPTALVPKHYHCGNTTDRYRILTGQSEKFL